MALYATNRFAGDGTTTQYEINFVGQYIDRSHVKAYRVDDATQVRTPVTITTGQWLNATTITGFAPTPVGQTLVIYRDTPKPPMVNFVDGSRFTEYNMDLVARQGLFVAMEALDAEALVGEDVDDLMDYRDVAVAAAETATEKADEAEASAIAASKLNLGDKASQPTTDNQGQPLRVGATYYDTTMGQWRVWDGVEWGAGLSISLSNDIHSAAEKPSPADADELPIVDSAASWALKKLTFAHLKEWLSGDLTVPSLNGGQLAGMRNKVINGAFTVNQAGYVSGGATAAGDYTFDQWKVSATGGITFSTVNGKTTVTIPPAQTLQQIIEAANLPGGTYVLSWEGTAQGRVNGGTYGASGAVTVTLAGGVNSTIEFNAGTLTNVQFEPGAVATPFEHRLYQAELKLCKYYWEKINYDVTSYAGAASQFTSVYVSFEEKRAQPSITNIAVSGSTNLTYNSMQSAVGNKKGVAFYFVSNAAGPTRVYGTAIVNARL